LKNKKTDDGLLVLKYQSGNAKALALLVKRWHKLFCEKAYWIVKDADIAKDVAQDSWKTIIDNINGLKDADRFGGWALRIVYNKSLDVLNAKKRTIKTAEAYEYQQEEVTVNDESDKEDLKRALLITIKTLPVHHQAVIKLFYVQDYSLKEISNILNISVGTAKSRLFHAREKLKQKLKDRNYEK
tara:strand:- start:228 stop:782 length:555 start_codon:yes stop_codon:yes gene_type:complete